MGTECISSLVEKGIDQELLVTRSLLTPQCGLSGMSEEVAAEALRTLVAVSERLREHYSL